MSKKQIKKIEKILSDYAKLMSVSQNIDFAKQHITACVNELNKFAEAIGTVER